MNRRGFIQTLSAAVATFAILPSATTYGRKWVKQGEIYVINPEYLTARWEIKFKHDPDDNKYLPFVADRILPASYFGTVIGHEFPMRFANREDAWSGPSIPAMILQRKIY